MKNAYEIKELLDNGGSICIYDTETTGLNIPISATVWQKGSLSRLYINNNKNHSVYFDIIGREWSFTSPEDEQMIEKLLGAYNLEVLIKNGRTMF
mgnify:CR=1 FL=1